MGIIEGGVVITGGEVIVGAGTRNPLTVYGVPVDGVAAVASQGTLTIAEPVTDGDTFTIGTTVYTMKTTPAAAYDVFIGADEAATKVNIVAAINLTGAPGTSYFAGTKAHPDVTAAAFSGDDCVLTANDAGVAGDTVATTETFTHASNIFDAATLGTTTAGVDEAGSYIGQVAAGGFVYDLTNEDLYENTGTLAVPAFGKIDA